MKLPIRSLILLSLSLCTFIASPLPLSAQDKIRIGVSTALSGNAATYGIDVKNSLIFANEKLADNKYELVFDDDKCNGREATSVAQKFINLLKLKYVTGFPCSGSLLSSASLYEKSGTLVMASGSSSEISQAGDFIFRTWPSDAGVSKVLYDHISKQHKNIGILTESTDYAEGLLNEFMKNTADDQITVVSDNFITEAQDYRATLTKFKNRKIDALYINTQSESTFLAVLKQAKTLGIDVTIYSAFVAESASFLENAKELADGIVVATIPSANDLLSSDGSSLFKEFEERFGKIRSFEFMFLSSFEGFRALHQAIESGQEPRRYLYSTKFSGLFGDWWFDKNGDIQGLKHTIKIVKDRKLLPIN